MKSKIIVLTAICFTLNLNAQRGYGISSAAYAYHHGGNGRVLSPDYIVEEEIFNYHTHKIEAANYNDPVKISHQWGNDNVNSKTDEMILQIGISTHRAKNLDNIPPANLSLVVDVSGSMSGDRIEKSKEAMKEFVKQLRSTDQVSLVLFGNQVSIPFKSQTIGDKKKLLEAIDNIEINGSTNVHLGMKEGYKQVASTYLSNGNNRVIVFSDAMANTGIIDPNEILDDTKVYIKDIDLTFIGVGMAFNQDFARQIKTRLRGHMHFVQDSKEITKLFKEEVEQFLAAPYGKDVTLSIEIPEQLTLSKLYGYDASISGNKIELELDDLQGGLTQIFVLKLERNQNYSGDIDPVKYGLTFDNHNGNKEIIAEESPKIEVLPNSDRYNKLENDEVKKNYCIAYMASQLKEACITYKSDSDEDKYYQRINQALASIDSEYKTLDADLKYVYDLLSNQTDSSKVPKNNLALNDTF
ncbi:MAG: VWA domain-containing protein [Brumimicrobium sp.]